ncbi:MAG: Acyl-CoA synthetase (AMP-forming)/AMP-acid ligase [Acidimicrobiales bacterium]|nr:Acyl-CoA synthetase (AMP-forming)/AMP-acid ligase [Acidimicrobiales bacterium]
MSGSGVSAHAAATPDKPALICGDEVVTYAQLDARTDRLAQQLVDAGAVAGQPVAVMLPNGIPFVEAAIASAKVGARFLPVNWHLKEDEVAFILEDSGAPVLVDEAWLQSAGEVGDVPHRDSGPAPLFMFYTSGTTARPKGVVHGTTMDAQVMALGQQGQVMLWGWTADDVHLLCGPAYHAGPGGWTSTALFIGATTVIMPSWDAREWLRLVERHRVTRAFMVPAHFIRILEVPDDERAAHDLSSLKLIVHAAAPCPVAVKHRIIDALPDTAIHELYGGSEGGATKISPEEWVRKPGSVGRPWPGVDVRVIADDGTPLPPNTEGRIYMTPMGGNSWRYHNRPDVTSDSWHDDVYTIGDVGYLDDDGYLFITDRASDMVLWGGVNIAPREVEEALYAHPGVVDCAVFGVPDDRDGERLKAVVEARPGVTADALADWVRERLADFKVPREWELVATLPRDPNGKVLKRRLRDAHWAGRAANV